MWVALESSSPAYTVNVSKVRVLCVCPVPVQGDALVSDGERCEVWTRSGKESVLLDPPGLYLLKTFPPLSFLPLLNP